jgi:hypothetical protein
MKDLRFITKKKVHMYLNIQLSDLPYSFVCSFIYLFAHSDADHMPTYRQRLWPNATAYDLCTLASISFVVGDLLYIVYLPRSHCDRI